MGKCKDCRFWERGICEIIETNKKSDELEEQDEAMIRTNDNAYYATFDIWFETGPEFGCVRFETN